ncbi:Mog1p [Pyrrhoderma noxium]|uniref:Mog1p n=1 Tax=Pyrrhoderma noxium TaxID=2282107 RepID=A0A286UUE6_9AGAM|nr:Mog1p [Pyrrhoderma noxium]
MTSTRELFGGAITAVFPSSYIDASTLRQIPDNQEVLVSPTSDISFIIEVLQRVPPTDPRDAARFHFDSLAHDNDAQFSEVLSVDAPNDNTQPKLNSTPPPILLNGLQRIAKFNHEQSDEVHILLAVYRIANNGLDASDLTRLKETFSAAAVSLKIVDFSLFA